MPKAVSCSGALSELSNSILPYSDPCASLLTDLDICLITQTSNLIMRQRLIFEVIIDKKEYHINIMSELFYF